MFISRGRDLVPNWLSAGLKLVGHQWAIITLLTNNHISSALWGMCLKHMGNEPHLCSNCEHPSGIHTHKDTHV